MDYYINIGPYIKEQRERRNMTKSQLAKDICSVSYITRIEKGERCPTSVILRQLATRLGINHEYLFRAIESPDSLKTKKLIEKIFCYIERNDFEKLSHYLDENQTTTTSIFDFQIIETFKHIANNDMNFDCLKSYEEQQDLLNLTYVPNTTPTDIEFVIMYTSAIYLKSAKEGYEFLKSIEHHIENIEFFHTPLIISAYYNIITFSCLAMKNYEEAIHYIEKGILHCKSNNTISMLIEFYYLKSLFFEGIEDRHNALIWRNKALSLNELISLDRSYFINRIKQFEKLKENDADD